MKRHLCATCKTAVEPQNIRGREFIYTNRMVSLGSFQNVTGRVAVVGRIYVATSPEAAQPGQDEPSGLCPVCRGPVFCAVTGAV